MLPVMFFIHGGAFYAGTYFGMGPKPLLDHDVVLVEIQYRLGPLGFMWLDHPDIAGNMGLMDQALALDRVRDHWCKQCPPLTMAPPDVDFLVLKQPA